MDPANNVIRAASDCFLVIMHNYICFLLPAKIDPPAFAMSSTEKSISVIIFPPEKWKRDYREEPKFLNKIYPDMQYNVLVYKRKLKKTVRLKLL